MNEQIKAIRAEIERLKEPHESNLDKPMERGRIGHAHGYVDCCDEILDFIDSLPEENGRTLFEEIAYPGSFDESSKQIRWRRIYKDERLPCPAYLWSVSFERYAPYWEGKLIPNIEGCRVGADTWYLPVSDLVSLHKEPE